MSVNKPYIEIMLGISSILSRHCSAHVPIQNMTSWNWKHQKIDNWHLFWAVPCLAGWKTSKWTWFSTQHLSSLHWLEQPPPHSDRWIDDSKVSDQGLGQIHRCLRHVEEHRNMWTLPEKAIKTHEQIEQKGWKRILKDTEKNDTYI